MKTNGRRIELLKKRGKGVNEALAAKYNVGRAKRRSDRAKVLTNDGELSKAFATMVERGVVPSTDKILTQLKTNFPSRSRIEFMNLGELLKQSFLRWMVMGVIVNKNLLP